MSMESITFPIRKQKMLLFSDHAKNIFCCNIHQESWFHCCSSFSKVTRKLSCVFLNLEKNVIKKISGMCRVLISIHQYMQYGNTLVNQPRQRLCPCGSAVFFCNKMIFLYLMLKRKFNKVIVLFKFHSQEKTMCNRLRFQVSMFFQYLCLILHFKSYFHTMDQIITCFHGGKCPHN